MILPALRAEAPLLLAATLIQALPGAVGQIATAGALIVLAFRLSWRSLRAEAPPFWPGAAGLAYMIRLALALGVWVMLVSLGFVGLTRLAQTSEPAALLGALLGATPLTLALAIPGLLPPLLPSSDSGLNLQAAPNLLAALAPATLARTSLWLFLLVMPACAAALAARLLLSPLWAAPALTGAVALTSLTLAQLGHQLVPSPRPAQIFS